MTIIYILISLIIVLLLVLRKNDYFQDHCIVTLSSKKEFLICLVLIGLSYTSIELQKIKADNFTEFEIGSLNQAKINQINTFDRGITGRWDIRAKNNGKVFKNTSIYLIPFSLFLFAGSLKRRLVLFFIFSQGYVLTESLTGLAKGLVNRYRPFAYRTINEIETLNPEAKEKFLEDIVDYDILNSFFSGDASIIAFGFVFFAYSYSLFYKERKYKNILWIIALIGVVLGCYYRTSSGKHFPTDVMIGAIVGFLVAFGILLIHKKSINLIELKDKQLPTKN
ncbi:phosphatase PAP2 family protein [uncultured Aquimarina sp.]|uniref:phosphatase PAP2 family protein n=1 Tax=uncultured Aquimarina sp. TaxID=575652 RepID=UPI0026073F49|nr:phosphatase PAP2 family protein [uncultured Aquimarina sp.]